MAALPGFSPRAATLRGVRMTERPRLRRGDQTKCRDRPINKANDCAYPGKVGTGFSEKDMRQRKKIPRISGA
jgi:hypothetical protein